MRLVKLQLDSGEEAVGVLQGERVALLKLAYQSLADILETDDPAQTVESLLGRGAELLPLSEANLLPPIDSQEVWAAGVTYLRSQTARMEESEHGASHYDRVYSADRPELFFKATPHRVVGPGQPVRIRADSNWNVPEPELTLVINSRGRLVGFTVGNDMSSRDIEGENPLYLPQAKVYNGSAALGPCVTLAGAMPPREETRIELVVRRGDDVAFQGETKVDQIARTFDDLIDYLTRDNSFPNGVFLMTGTGVVPGDDFTLAPGDVVEISIDGIGTLSNPVVQG